MSDRFACEFFLEKRGGEVLYQNTVELASTFPFPLKERVAIEEEIFMPLVMEDERIQIIPDGGYKVYIQGTVWWDAEFDSEGYTGGSWVFEANEKDILFKEVTGARNEKS